jgi:GNAT superfamily N-acetyltransferase
MTPGPALPIGYRLEATLPSLEDYRRLRVETGRSPRAPEAAARGLAGSLFALQLVHEGRVVGMARVIGDGGCFFQVVDVAVDPDHPGRGLGRALMAAVLEWLASHVPETGYVSLLPDVPANGLYAQFGFRPTAPETLGMALEPSFSRRP